MGWAGDPYGRELKALGPELLPPHGKDFLTENILVALAQQLMGQQYKVLLSCGLSKDMGWETHPTEVVAGPMC